MVGRYEYYDTLAVPVVFGPKRVERPAETIGVVRRRVAERTVAHVRRRAAVARIGDEAGQPGELMAVADAAAGLCVVVRAPLQGRRQHVPLAGDRLLLQVEDRERQRIAHAEQRKGKIRGVGEQDRRSVVADRRGERGRQSGLVQKLLDRLRALRRVGNAGRERRIEELGDVGAGGNRERGRVVVSPRDALALNAEFGRRWLAMNWYDEPKNRSSQNPPTCVRSFGFHWKPAP